MSPPRHRSWPLEATPWTGVAPPARRYRSTAGRSLYELRSTDGLPGRWLRFRMQIEGRLTAPPRLILDAGAGFAEAAVMPLPMPRAGLIETVVDFPSGVKGVLLELEHEAGVGLGALHADELGRAESGWR